MSSIPWNQCPCDRKWIFRYPYQLNIAKNREVSMTRRIVAITGIGTLTPAGRGTEALWKSICSDYTCLAPIDPQKYFDPSSFTCQVAGQVPSFSEPRVLTDAVMEQTDRCSQLAMVAALD